MKHMLFFLVLLLSISLSAQQTDSLFHKYQMIDAINRGEYSNAANLILQDTATIIPTIYYLDSIGLEKEKIDSVSSCVINELYRSGIEYNNNGNFLNALNAFQCIQQIFQYLQKTNHLDYAVLLQNIGYIYYQIGDVELSQKYMLQVLDMRESILGTTHPDYATSLSDLGYIYYMQGNYHEAEIYYLQALEIRESVLGSLHPDYLISIGNLGILYETKGEYIKAEFYYLKEKDIYKSLYGIDINYAEILRRLYNLYFVTNDYTKSKMSLLENVEILKSLLGISHLNYATSLRDLGFICSLQGDYHEAETYYLQALEIFESTLGLSHPDCNDILIKLGNIFLAKKDLPKAKLNFLKVVENTKDLLDVHYLASINGLGLVYLEIGDYASAERCWLEILKYSQSHSGAIYHNLGLLYEQKGDFDRAKMSYIEALKDSTMHISSYIKSITSLGGCCVKLGLLDEAELYLIEAKDLCNSTLGALHEHHVIILNLLGDMYIQLGDYVQSEKFLLEALDICELIKKDNRTYGTTLLNLGVLYASMGEYLSSEKYYLHYMDLFATDMDLHTYPIALVRIGNLYKSMGRYLEAEYYFKKTIEYCEMNNNMPVYASAIGSIGLLYFIMEDYDHAEFYYLKVIESCNSFFQNLNRETIYWIHRLGLNYSRKGDFINALNSLQYSFNSFKYLFLSSMNYMTEYQRECYWMTMQNYFEYSYPSFSYKYHFADDSISTFAYNNELFVKGLLLNSSESVKRSIIESNDTILIRQWNELTTKKQQIQVLQEKEPQSNYLKQIEAEAEQLEKQITRSSAAFREHQAMWQITWDSVRNHLSPNEVAIEYFSAPLSEDSTMYCALLLRHDSEHPEMIPLFEQKEITSFMSFGSPTITNQTYDFYGNGDTISQLIWSKILPKINESETIYFAPSGLLHQLAIEYLPYDEERTMSDVYNMVRLSSTREIVMNKPQLQNTTATIYGGITYDIDATSMLDESRAYDSADLLASRSLENDTLNRGTAQYLLGTKIEAEHINTLLQENNITAQLYTTTKANEESFKALSGKHNNILHIGTHGFTWTDSTAQKQDYFTQRMQMQLLGEEHRHHGPIIDPLNRCGLLFAGANIALQGNSKHLPEGVQDGILTAKEISLMDLRDANLVVLSACETAKGDITSEGVFGLQRAFKMAGVQTIIMSLWKVSDKATQLLMTEFYNNWIGKDQSKREAFRNAQNTVRTQYEEPEYWAGFIMLD